jgi:hypothetical protein
MAFSQTSDYKNRAIVHVKIQGFHARKSRLTGLRQIPDLSACAVDETPDASVPN